ncbi:endoglucanase A-like isoform X2 [Ptychodera flava]
MGKGGTCAATTVIIIIIVLVLAAVCAVVVIFIVEETQKETTTEETRTDPIGGVRTTQRPDVKTTATTAATTTEILPCDIDNGGCSHVCTPTQGSRICSCPVGQLLRNDTVTCIYDYADVLNKSLLFYEAQRSGKLPDDNRIPWRGDSALDDQGENGEDLSGGYYDAGDHLKLGLPMAWAATVLTWGFIEFRDAYEAAGQVDHMYDCIKWFTDYFIKCHTGENEFYAHVGSVSGDHGYWGRPEDMTMARPAYKLNETLPGTDCVGSTVAALAAASIAFKDRDANYSALLLQEARELYTFAYDFRGNYGNSIPEAATVYASTSFGDDITWAAMWMYHATHEQHYLDNATDQFNRMPKKTPYAFGWGDVNSGHRLLLLKATGSSTYLNLITTKFVDKWLPGASLPYTTQGQVFRNEWGSLRYSTSTAFVALMTAHYGYKVDEYIEWAKTQVDIALGDTGRSYVVGFGVNPPQRPHHRSSSCPYPPDSCGWPVYRDDGPNHHVLHGALVGGPQDLNGYYDDLRDSHFMNEVTLDYNAGFQSALAGLKHFELLGLL